MYEEEYDNLKTKILKYIMYKKRTEKEVKQKFPNIDEDMLDKAIEYMKDAGYIDDLKYVDRAVNEFININTLSIKEIKYKLMRKGIDNEIIDSYICKNINTLEEYEANCAKKIYNKRINSEEKISIINFLKRKGYTEDSINRIAE